LRATPLYHCLLAVGPGPLNGPIGDNGAAVNAALGSPVGGLFVTPDGTLLIADTGVNRARAVAPPLGGYSSNGASFSFASSDGSEIYTFDGTGQHMQTLDALTQRALYSFTYDSGGRLASVTDVNGDTTQISHDGNGNPLSLVGPFGETTTFAVDSNGYLASVTDPLGDQTQFTYASGGLMSTMTDARGGLHQFAYDGLGRLVEDQDPAGGTKILTRTASADPTGFNVKITTTLGRTTNLQTTQPFATGSFDRNNTLPDGTQAFSVRAAFKGLALPAKIVFGSEDRIIPARHAQGLPGRIAIHLFRGLGHMPHFEAREEVAALWREIMRSA